MRSYAIALAILLFGFVAGMINGSGLFDVQIAGADYTSGIDQMMAEELTGGASTAEWNPLGGLSSLGVLISTLGQSLIAVVTIIPLLTSLGIPLVVAMCIQGPIWFVYAWDLFNWVGNRPTNA